jgi:hypothetical protein
MFPAGEEIMFGHRSSIVVAPIALWFVIQSVT